MEIIKVLKQHDCLLIVNEVTTGFGRQGKWFSFEHYDLKPDIVVVGKGLGNGHPISALSTTERISKLFDKNPMRYTQSHQNDPLGCAIGLEVIKIIDEEGLIQSCFKKGEYFKEQLNQFMIKHNDKIEAVRARGLMLAIEIKPEINGELLKNQLFDEGFLVGYKDNVFRFMPPLTIKESDISIMTKMFNKLLMS